MKISLVIFGLCLDLDKAATSLPNRLRSGAYGGKNHGIDPVRPRETAFPSPTRATKQLPFFLNSAKGSNLTPLGNAFDVKLDPPVKTGWCTRHAHFCAERQCRVQLSERYG